MLDTRRLLSAGALDPTFGQGGVATTDVPGPGSANEVFLLAGGKVLAAGNTSAGFALVRYNANGSLDTAFGTAGKTLTTDFRDISVQVLANGQILAAGTTAAFPNGQFAMARYNANGTPDKTFGTNGLVVGLPGTFSAEAVTFSVLGNGTILVTTFGPAGSNKVRTGAIGAVSESGNSLDLLADGQFIVAGSAFTGTNSEFVLARYQG